MNCLRMSGIGWDLYSIPRTQQELIAHHIHDQHTLENNPYLIKRMPMVANRRMRWQTFDLWKETFIFKDGPNLNRGWGLC